MTVSREALLALECDFRAKATRLQTLPESCARKQAEAYLYAADEVAKVRNPPAQTWRVIVEGGEVRDLNEKTALVLSEQLRGCGVKAHVAAMP